MAEAVRETCWPLVSIDAMAEAVLLACWHPRQTMVESCLLEAMAAAVCGCMRFFPSCFHGRGRVDASN